MMDFVKAYSFLPNLRGKNMLGQKFLAIFPSLKRFKRVQKMRTGFTLELDLTDRMQSVIYLMRCHEPETEVVFKEIAKTTNTFIDVGANIGYFSFLVKQMSPQAQIHSFEPLPKNIESYKKNRELNSFSDMHLYESCVADRMGETEFLIPPLGESGWGRMAHRELFSGQKIKRDVITLDQFCAEKKITKVDLMKIDVEGYEMKVLQGAKQLIEKSRPKICIEINEPCLVDTGTSGAEIFSYLQERAYQMYALDKQRTLVAVDRPLEKYTYLNYFAFPK
jgi:FkbM family methyltransferase